MNQNTIPVYQSEQGYADTLGIGGDRFGTFPASMFAPMPFVGTTSVGTIGTLSIPPTYANLGQAQATYGALGANAAGSAPWSPKASPLPWVIVALVVGVFGIHKLYYSKKRRG